MAKHSPRILVATVQQTPTKISSSVTPGGKQREGIDSLEFQKNVLSHTPGENQAKRFLLRQVAWYGLTSELLTSLPREWELGT